MSRRKIPLTREQILAIWADTRTISLVAVDHGVSGTTVRLILDGKIHSTITGGPNPNAARGAGRPSGRWRYPETQTAMSDQMKSRWEDPEERARLRTGQSKGTKLNWQDPEVRARRIAGMKAANERKRSNPDVS